MNSICRSIVRAGGVALWIALSAAAATGQEAPAPPHPPPAAPAGDASKPAPPEVGFHPEKSVWSRISAREIPKDVKEPTGAELAARLGLEVVGVQPPDDSVRYRNPRNGMLFVFVPGGTFRFGSNYSDIYNNRQVIESAARSNGSDKAFNWEQPQAEVYVSPFFMSVFEVTNAEYRQFLEEAKAGKLPPDCEHPLGPLMYDHTPFLWQRPELPFWGDRQPVVGVSWYDAWAFCHWMGGRLPTECEWEKAARGPDGRLWPWGNTFDSMRANTAESQNHRTVEVGTYPGGRSVYGCYDMAGNAQEYCIDVFEETTYGVMAKKDPCLIERVSTSDKRVVRGGCWNHLGVLYKSRCTARGMIQRIPKYSEGTVVLSEYLTFGIRVVLSPDVDLYPPDALAKGKIDRDRHIEQMKKMREKGENPPPDGKQNEQKKDGG